MIPSSLLTLGGAELVQLALLVLWSMFWKGLALWHASGRNDAKWFITILIVNTAGILELVYLFGIAHLRVEELFKKHSVVVEGALPE